MQKHKHGARVQIRKVTTITEMVKTANSKIERLKQRQKAKAIGANLPAELQISVMDAERKEKEKMEEETKKKVSKKHFYESSPSFKYNYESIDKPNKKRVTAQKKTLRIYVRCLLLYLSESELG